MKTLQTHTEEIEEQVQDFAIQWVNRNCDVDYNNRPQFVADFITSQNKQLYIKIAERELKRLNQNQATQVFPVGDNGFTFLGNNPFAEKCIKEDFVNGYNEAIENCLLYWNNILQELNK